MSRCAGLRHGVCEVPTTLMIRAAGVALGAADSPLMPVQRSAFTHAGLREWRRSSRIRRRLISRLARQALLPSSIAFYEQHRFHVAQSGCLAGLLIDDVEHRSGQAVGIQLRLPRAICVPPAVIRGACACAAMTTRIELLSCMRRQTLRSVLKRSPAHILKFIFHASVGWRRRASTRLPPVAGMCAWTRQRSVSRVRRLVTTGMRARGDDRMESKRPVFQGQWPA